MKKQIETEENHAEHQKHMEEAYVKKMLVEDARFQELKQSKEVEAASWVQRMATMNMAHERALQVPRIGHSLCAVLFNLHSKIGNSQVC
jgi:hypothetical protein